MNVIKIVRILLEVVGAVTVCLFRLIAFLIVQAKSGSPRRVNDDVLPSVFARVGLVANHALEIWILLGDMETAHSRPHPRPLCANNLRGVWAGSNPLHFRNDSTCRFARR
jgi:hypothetical protein